MSTSNDTKANVIGIECDMSYDLPNYTCIQYPGKINNIENAIETFGGNNKIQETFVKFNEFQTHNTSKQRKKTKSHQEPYLELHLNPSLHFDHALFGKIRNTKSCILIKKTTKIPKKNSLLRKRKFSQTNNNNQNQTTSIENNHTNYCSKSEIEVMGRITSLVTYDELCDFQVFSDLKYPKKVITNNVTNSQKHIHKKFNIIHNTNKRRRIWSLSEEDIPNINKYPLIPPVFAAKAMAYHDFIKRSGNKSNAKQSMNTNRKQTEICFHKQEVPQQPADDTLCFQWFQDFNEKFTGNENNSFCSKIRNELVLQIKAYFDQQPIWVKTEIFLQKFYISWDYIKCFAARTNKNKNTDTVYDFDIVSVIMNRKQKRNVYLNSNYGLNTDLDNSEKIYLDFNEKKKIIGKLLGIVAYKFKNGPFRNSFIKFGFDPRAYCNRTICRPLQIIDYRIDKNRKKLGIENEWSGGRISKRGKPIQKGNSNTFESITSIMNNYNKHINTETKSMQNDKLEQQIRDMVQFKIKPHKNRYYQLRNINIRTIQQIINNMDLVSYNSECTFDCGWILKKDYVEIRELMHKKVDVWIVEQHKRKQKDELIASLLSKKTEINDESEEMNQEFVMRINSNPKDESHIINQLDENNSESMFEI